MVLPIVCGDPNEILVNYPLLRDKQYKNWDDGIDSLVNELSQLLSASNYSGATFEQVFKPDYITEISASPVNIPENVNNGIILNEFGELCLVHNYSFKGIPFFTVYHIDRKQVEIVFTNGDTAQIEWVPNEEIEANLLKESKILLVQMNNYKPIEGFTTSLIRIKDGKMIDDKTLKRYLKKNRFYHWLTMR